MTTSRSQPLRAAWRGRGEHVAVVVAGLGGEADDQLPGRALGDQLGEDVGVADQRHGARLGGRALLHLRGRRPTPGRKSATAAAITTTSASAPASSSIAVAQLLGGADRHDPHAGRGGQLDVGRRPG